MAYIYALIKAADGKHEKTNSIKSSSVVLFPSLFSKTVNNMVGKLTLRLYRHLPDYSVYIGVTAVPQMKQTKKPVIYLLYIYL